MAFPVKGSKFTGKPGMNASGNKHMGKPVMKTPAPAGTTKVAGDAGHCVGPTMKDKSPYTK